MYALGHCMNAMGLCKHAMRRCKYALAGCSFEKRGCLNARNGFNCVLRRGRAGSFGGVSPYFRIPVTGLFARPLPRLSRKPCKRYSTMGVECQWGIADCGMRRAERGERRAESGERPGVKKHDASTVPTLFETPLVQSDDRMSMRS